MKSLVKHMLAWFLIGKSLNLRHWHWSLENTLFWKTYSIQVHRLSCVKFFKCQSVHLLANYHFIKYRFLFSVFPKLFANAIASYPLNALNQV